MQEMGVGQTKGKGGSSLVLLPVQEEADGTNKAVPKLTLLPNEFLLCNITPYYILYDESYDDTA